jgi:alpha-glucosidase
LVHHPTQCLLLTLVIGVANGTNLYSDHPIYFEHRTSGTHGVFLLNSNGMDVKLRSISNATTLEYNVIGGVLDFYFLAGPSPIEVAKQYAHIVGFPAEIPYWGLGFHQCRYGYQNYLDVAQVVANYSAAGIPLETMWTDSEFIVRY